MIFLDTNIILELLNHRRQFKAVVAALEPHQNQTSAVSTLTLSNLFYFTERDKQDLQTTEALLKSYVFLEVNSSDADWAFSHYGGKDFEDALQAACAVRQKVSSFLTLDKELAKKYQKYLNIELIG